MGTKHQSPDGGYLEWKKYINNLIAQHHVDIQRIWRLLGMQFGPGTAPFDGTPWTPLPGTGSGGKIVEGYLAGILQPSTFAGDVASTATLNLWAVVSGNWQATGDTVTVSNRSYHLWLPPTTHLLQCTKINGEYRPMIQSSPPFRATLTSNLTAGGSATANLLYDDGGSWVTYSPNISLTVYPALNLGTTTIASGKGVWLNFTGGYHFVVGADC